MAIAMSDFLTVNEVAKRLRVSRNTVIMLIDRKELQAARVGNQYRIMESDLLDYVNRIFSQAQQESQEDKPEQK